MPTSLLNPARPADSLTLDVALLADIVEGLAAADGLWRRHVTHDAAERVRLRLLATPAYEVWLLGWAPGQSVGMHDHGDANGAFVVVDGELVERTLTECRVVTETRHTGAVGRIPRGAVHDVANRSPRLATSIHAYSRPLTAMGFYRADGSLVRTEAVHEQSVLVSASELAKVLHPSHLP
jgi:predicted metal-dependent enzyme (double-stranded beta helix superfamily)